MASTQRITVFGASCVVLLLGVRTVESTLNANGSLLYDTQPGWTITATQISNAPLDFLTQFLGTPAAPVSFPAGGDQKVLIVGDTTVTTTQTILTALAATMAADSTAKMYQGPPDPQLRFGQCQYIHSATVGASLCRCMEVHYANTTTQIAAAIASPVNTVPIYVIPTYCGSSSVNTSWGLTCYGDNMCSSYIRTAYLSYDNSPPPPLTGQTANTLSAWIDAPGNVLQAGGTGSGTKVYLAEADAVQKGKVNRLLNSLIASSANPPTWSTIHLDAGVSTITPTSYGATPANSRLYQGPLDPALTLTGCTYKGAAAPSAVDLCKCTGASYNSTSYNAGNFPQSAFSVITNTSDQSALWIQPGQCGSAQATGLNCTAVATTDANAVQYCQAAAYNSSTGTAATTIAGGTVANSTNQGTTAKTSGATSVSGTLSVFLMVATLIGSLSWMAV